MEDTMDGNALILPNCPDENYAERVFIDPPKRAEKNWGERQRRINRKSDSATGMREKEQTDK